jgi:nicotinate-nucleotide pyrophosphorylase (carboxylating)
MKPAPEKIRSNRSFGAEEREEAAWLIERALQEDRVREDLTAGILFPGGLPGGCGMAVLVCIAKQDGVLCGREVVEMLYQQVDPRVVVTAAATDGEAVRAGQVVCELTGPPRALLAGERAALNFLQRLSGIATVTSRWLRELEGFSTALMDTRKTTPGWRYLEKYAVRVGGGLNHRFSLADAILLKDNHACMLRAAGRPHIAEWVESLRREAPGVFLEIEVDSRDEFLEARRAPVDAILLDNFTPEDLSWAVDRNRALGPPRPLLEASGGVTLERLRAVAATGVDRISAGALTHSAQAMDFGLEAEGPDR